MTVAPQTSDGLCDLPLETIADLIGRRQVSPVEVTRSVLERIERLDDVLNAFITVLAESSLAAAHHSETEILAGRSLGPLHGIPVTVKDMFETAGIRTTAGSRILADFVPERDAAVIARLAEAGAILAGKTNLLEFAYGNVHPDYGLSPNPWNLGYSAGGSSSGSAVALAAGMGYGSIGTDTGGSIRIPSSFCGVAGMKPTFGRVSRNGLIPLSSSTDHVGPMAKTVGGAALLFSAIADDRPNVSSVFAPAGAGGPLAGVRIGIDDRYFRADVDQDVLLRAEAALQVLIDLGGSVREVSLPAPEFVINTVFTVRVPEATAAHGPWRDTRAAEYSDAVRERVASGWNIPAVSYIEALRDRDIITAQFEALFDEVDVLVMPTVAVPAPDRAHDPTLGIVDSSRTAALIRSTSPFNLTGLPAVTVSCGFTEIGLPVGIQVAGRTNNDVEMLRIARAYEQAVPWHTHRPPVLQS